MANKPGKVIFRRYKGRVIPIRTKGDYIKGGATIAGAMGTTILGGYAAAKAVRASASLKHLSKAYYKVAKGKSIQMDMFKSDKWFSGRVGGKLIKSPLKASKYIRLASVKAFRLRNTILAVATLGGAALLSAGVERVYKAKTGKHFDIAEQVGADVFSVAVSGVTAAAYYKFLPTTGKMKMKNVLQQAFARARGKPRPYHIPIKHKQGVLKFD